jgi:nicotinamide-nucleotide amidase
VHERGFASAIVSVGNELLYGQTVDSNAAWLGRVLAEWGLPVARRYTVGDRAADIREAVSAARPGVDLVVVTGGLGPTPDDITKPTVAAMLGLDLVVHERLRERLQQRFCSAGYDDIPLLSRGQAEVPRGAVPLTNPEGTAPGLLIEADEQVLVLLPGVPAELKAIVSGDLRPALAARLDPSLGGRNVHHRTVHTTGIGETSLAERLEPCLADVPDDRKADIDLAYLPDARGVDLRFSIRGGEHEEAQRRFDALLEALDPVLEPFRFEASSGDIAEAVSNLLRRSGRTLAVAESCTGGLVAKRMTERPGASQVFLGGVVAYSNAAKIEQVGVSAEDLERDGAVSEVVARQLAERVAERFGADAAIGITGVAGPGGGSEEKPVGSVWIGTTVDGMVEATLGRFPGDRASVRERSAQAALATLHRRLLGVSRKG